jgi:hypothetical protein
MMEYGQEMGQGVGRGPKKLLQGNEIHNFCARKSTVSKYFHERISDGHVFD